MVKTEGLAKIANDFSVGHLGCGRGCLPMNEKARRKMSSTAKGHESREKNPQWALSSVKHE